MMKHYLVGGRRYIYFPERHSLVRTDSVRLAKAGKKGAEAPGQMSLFGGGGDFEGDKHPRANDGKFTSKANEGGGGGAQPEAQRGDGSQQKPASGGKVDRAAASKMVAAHIMKSHKDAFAAEGARGGKISREVAAKQGIDPNHPGAAWDQHYYKEHLQAFKSGKHAEHIKQDWEGDLKFGSDNAIALQNKMAHVALDAADFGKVDEYINARIEGNRPDVGSVGPETKAIADYMDDFISRWVEDDENPEKYRKILKNQIAKLGARKWLNQQINFRSSSYDHDLQEGLANLAPVDWNEVSNHVANHLNLHAAHEYEKAKS